MRAHACVKTGSESLSGKHCSQKPSRTLVTDLSEEHTHAFVGVHGNVCVSMSVSVYARVYAREYARDRLSECVSVFVSVCAHT